MSNSQPASKVLLVEDNPDDESLTLRGLRSIEPQPITYIARDGALAVEWLEANLLVERPQLVLLDLKLPKLNGKEVLQTLLTLDGGDSVPVVVFSSSDDREEISACMALGARSYKRKPIDFDEYLKTVQEVAREFLCSSGQ